MLRVIGLLSGTSADGIDAALCEIDGAPPKLSARIVRGQTLPYAPALRERILAAMQAGGADAQEMAVLNVEIGKSFAQAAREVAGEDCDLIGSHGQTVWHQVEADGRVTATLQIGEAAEIAERTGLTVVNNFRARDVAAGGQGAPLVGYLDWLLLRHESEWRAVQNIGGVGNVTFLPPLNAPGARMMAFDTGPGNALLDNLAALMSNGRLSYDEDGAWAAQGRVDEGWLAELMEHPYFRQPPPKTTGRELFSPAMAAELKLDGQRRGLDEASVLATVTALTAESIAAACRNFPPAPVSELILAGGGRLNRTLVAMLRQWLTPARVSVSDDYGIDGDFKEALLFAVLAYETWHNRIGSLPEQTGAAHGSVLGQITPGANYAALLRRTWRP
ncbi:MAG: anhydro-N-acetylmuramic acid kinase [Anaerolineae bacterium]|nr:anhydro-N-acetylmuramic acid kinase [Anaerolineae bacterium]